jgi:4-hydroxyphenylpyruvate dioxygenase-like putative hemolysin
MRKKSVNIKTKLTILRLRSVESPYEDIAVGLNECNEDFKYMDKIFFDGKEYYVLGIKYFDKNNNLMEMEG